MKVILTTSFIVVIFGSTSVGTSALLLCQIIALFWIYVYVFTLKYSELTFKSGRYLISM